MSHAAWAIDEHRMVLAVTGILAAGVSCCLGCKMYREVLV